MCCNVLKQRGEASGQIRSMQRTMVLIVGEQVFGC